MNLTQAEVGKQYVVKSVSTKDKETDDFLFTLGCYEGETITVVAKVSDTYVVVIKDGRYSIDARLASSIEI